MISAAFVQWVKDCRITKAAELLTEFEVARGAKPVTYQLIQDWLKNESIPPRRIPAVSAVSGIPKEILDPHMYAA